MKPVLEWVKSNLVIVISMVVAIAAIPAMLYFSISWNAEIKETVEGEVQDATRSLEQIRVTYEVPAVGPDDEAWSESTVPTRSSNEAVRERLAVIVEGSERVRELAESRNREGKRVLVGGEGAPASLFPSPPDEGARVRLLTELLAALPAEHEELLSRFRIGAPPDADRLAVRLNGLERRLEQERLTGRAVQELEAGERAEIRRSLVDERLRAYREQAGSLTMYGDISAFEGLRPALVERSDLPTLETAWEWQFLTWIHQDIVGALALANSDPQAGSVASGWQPVPVAPVKRLLSVRVDRHGPSASASAADTGFGRGGRGGGGGPAPPPPPTAAIAPDFSIAHTGRSAWPNGNPGLYDIRYATVDAVVDANQLPAVIDAFARTNFMTVIGVSLSGVDGASALGEGYVYGDGAVMRATLRVETVWLRSWMAPLMPEQVRSRLGLPEEAEPAQDEAEAGRFG